VSPDNPHAYELPPSKSDAYKRALKLEWLTIGHFVIAVSLMYVVLGSSQAMKAAWLEDLLSFIPPIAFLIASRIRYREPDEDHPYGFHRVVAIGFLASALALLVLGLFLFYDSVSALAKFDHPPIGTVQPFGDPIWLGWLMIGALAYTAIPSVILGRLKTPVAAELHDRILFADARMNRADWLTPAAAILGVIGIRFGLWWADSVAAIFISIDIVHDGWSNTRNAVASLMDKRPMDVTGDQRDPLPTRVKNELEKKSWVKEARVRMREEGHVYYGEAFVVVSDSTNLPQRIEEAMRDLMDLDWRLYDIVISPVPRMEEPQRLSEEKLAE
jgi:cation diffusion facilitator family transporter